jgi:hypothetical protein
MEKVCALFEFRVFKMMGEWHVTCGFPLKKFKTKREAVSWCKRAAKAFRNKREDVRVDCDGNLLTNAEYCVAARLKNILMGFE